MKLRISSLLVMTGSALLPGCAFFDPPQSEPAAEAPMKIVPFAKLQDSRGSAEAWYTLGRHMQRAGRLDEAANAYHRALGIDAGHTEARNGLAAVSAGQGDIEQAIAILEQLNSARPGQAHVLANLGYARSLKGQYLTARIALEEAAALSPDSVSIRAKLDAVLAAMGEGPHPSPGEGVVEVPVTIALADGRAEDVIVPLSPGIYELRQQGVIAVPAPVLEEVRVTLAGRDGSNPQPKLTATEPNATASPRSLPQAAAPQPAAPAGTAAVQRIAERVEIVNGNGVAGLARSLRALISGDWKVIRVLNHDSYSVRATRIEYAKSHYPAARQLAVDLGVDAQLRPKPAADDVHLRVVLGHDYRNLDPLRGRLGVAIARIEDQDSLNR